MDDLLTEFLTETSESLAVIDVELVKFEQDPQDEAILGNIFRLVHTIKGTCGFLGLPRLESVAHAGENVLGKIRDGVLEVNPEAVTLILKCIDKVRELLDGLENTGEEPEGHDKDLIGELNAMADGDVVAASASDVREKIDLSAPEDSSGPITNEFGAPIAQELLDEVAAAGGGEPEKSGPMLNEFGAPIAQELMDEVEEATAAGVKPASDASMKAEAEAEVAAEAEKPAPASVPVPAKAKPKAEKAAAKSKEGGGVAASSIRVNVDVLEDLMTLVSELVLTRNQLLQMVRGHDDSEFKVPLQRLSHITSDLQEGVMKTRMQPIGNAWAKLPRIVRDLALEQDKLIDLVMLGAETELDRQVLELIKDPLTHMVRNSADHGLEDPAGRAEAGKKDKGTITLDAFHEGGHIIIRIADDGRGLNMDRIKQKILDNGLASESELESMSDQTIQQYIFAAGFSTAEKVTNISGRGVGMDVVRTNIEKIGGTVELKSIVGKGSTFTIKIPLTLAIVSALIVACENQRFAIPQISVLELVRASAKSDNPIEMINEAPVLRLRNRLLPLVPLKNLLKLGDDSIKVDSEVEMFIVVTQVGNNSFGIIVDRVFDTEEIVVKPVAPILRDIPFYSGNTILGDGSVIMILDPNGIATEAGQLGRDADADVDEAAQASMDQEGEKTSMLVFRAGGEELKAVPLALIARLEEVNMEEAELSHGQYMVQYRGSLMPLIPFDPSHEFQKEGRQPVLVFTDKERSMGLAVTEIIDIVEDYLKIEIAADVEGLIGSAVIDGKATDVIDAGYYLTQAFSDWFGSADQGTTLEDGSRKRRVLLVDDSPFFRNLLSPLLSVAGWQVTTKSSAVDALELRANGFQYDVIISDIEMPDMNGFEFATDIRSGGIWASTPLIALSSHATEEDFQKGRDAGYNDYIAKFDREALVESLAQTVASVADGK